MGDLQAGPTPITPPPVGSSAQGLNCYCSWRLGCMSAVCGRGLRCFAFFVCGCTFSLKFTTLVLCMFTMFNAQRSLVGHIHHARGGCRGPSKRLEPVEGAHEGEVAFSWV